MADVTKAVKETLLGSSESQPEVQVTAQSKATFEKHSRKDEGEGESYMSEEDFVNAVAPVGEDYVSCPLCFWLCFGELFNTSCSYRWITQESMGHEKGV